MLIKQWFRLLALWMLTLCVACYLDRDVQCESDSDCLGGATCQQKLCVCPGQQSVCNAGTPNIICVDLQTNAQHCGSCGNNCASAELCDKGRCVGCDASKGHILCAGGCVDTQTNPQHCGSCGNQCQGGRECREGKCLCPSDHVVCNNVCVNTQNNASHCGSCDQKCPDGLACVKGQCAICKQMCGNECPDFKTDPRHCGKCDHACQKNERCCDGQCTDVQNNPAHCGQCDNKCAQGSSCEKGLCLCQDGEASCGGKCVDLKTDAEHCGKCNNACTQGQICLDGLCCAKGSGNCGGVCADLQSDPENCGKCAQSCGGQICNSGTCRPCKDHGDCGQSLTCDNGLCICGSKCGWLANAGNKEAEIIPRAIAVDSKQRVYIAGSIRGDAVFADSLQLPSQGGFDIFVARLDAKGKFVWAKRFGGSGEDEAYAIAVDQADNLYIAGSFAKQVAFEQVNLVSTNDSLDIFVAALDANGKLRWAKRAGGEGSDRALALALDGKGGLLLTGSFAKQASFGAITLPSGAASTQTSELFVAKLDQLDSGGNFAWATMPQGTAANSGGGAIGRGIAVASDGSIYVTGQCADGINIDNQTICTTGSDMLALKLKADGSQFTHGVATTGSAIGNAIALDAVNKPYIAGYFEQQVKFKSPLAAPGIIDAFVCNLDSNFDFEATIQAKGNPEAEAKAIAIKDQQICITGVFKQNIFSDALVQKAVGDEDIFVACLDHNSQWTWSIAAGGVKEDRGMAIAIDQYGGLYVTGYFQEQVANFQTDNNQKPIIAKGIRDLFVWKIPQP